MFKRLHRVFVILSTKTLRKEDTRSDVEVQVDDVGIDVMRESY